MAATFHTYGRLLHHTQYARSRWCIVQCPPLHCNTFECTTNLMIVGMLSTALFPCVKCQDQRISKNCRITFIFYSSWNLYGSPFFTLSLPGGRRAPLPTHQLRHCILRDGFVAFDSYKFWRSTKHANREPRSCNNLGAFYLTCFARVCVRFLQPW